MKMPKIADHNIQTGEITVRDMTNDEYEQYQKDTAQAQDSISKLDAQIAAKQSALIKLEALGLTEDEAKAILG
jgi:cell division septum initiation protein DivIVA